MRALVTGASSGIGQALLPWLAGQGGPRHDLVLVARRADALDAQKRALEARFGVTVTCLPMDLSAPDAADALFARTQELGLDVDVLVNNAGFGMYGRFVEQDLARVREMTRLNVLTLTDLTRLYVEPMVKRGFGRVLQVASTAAYQPGPRMAVYYATKAFVLSFSEALSVELEGTGVTVTTLCPGPTRSEFNDTAHYKVTPLVEKTLMTSEDVARIGYHALMKGERTAIAGTANKILAAVSQRGPRAAVLKVTERLMRTRDD
jgi:hypothetical protein